MSARYDADRIPTGTLRSAAMPTIVKVPTIALPNPPPGENADGGSAVSAVQLRRLPPRYTSIDNTENSGRHARTEAPTAMPLNVALISVRGERSEASSLP